MDRVVRLTGDIAFEGKKAKGPQDAHALESLLRDFLMRKPFIPTDRAGRINLPQLSHCSRRFATCSATT